ncbi:MAG: hypothetical protein LIR46_05360 [Bacteroidota bacterium]|nr:hypothetical protein [Bacteroidota bacterium]
MKTRILTVLMLLAMVAPLSAQVYKEVDKSPKERLQDFLDETATGINKAGKTIGDFLGINAEGTGDEVKIDGVKYMRIYTSNLFYADSTDMLTLCRKDFAQRYPQAEIVSVVIPQRSWNQTALKEGSKITAYKRMALCYVLAKDGKDGYINARYSFRQLRNPGKRWTTPEGYWPRFDRADAIPNVHYEQLKLK